MVDITVTSVTCRVQVSHHINLCSCHRLGIFIIVSEALTIYIQNATGQLYKTIDRWGGFLTVEEENNLDCTCITDPRKFNSLRNSQLWMFFQRT